MIKIKSKNIRFFSIFLASAPFLLFSLFFLKVYIGIPLAIIIVFLLDFVIKKAIDKDDRYYEISRIYIIFIYILMVVWIIFGGHGSFWSQYWSDWPSRNAIYRDLCNFDWPVVYDDNSFLCYYFGYFLPPAFVSKIFTMLPLSASLVDRLEKIVEVLYTAFYLEVIVLLIFNYVNIKLNHKIKNVFRYKHILIVLAIFVLFSGLDYLGYKLFTYKAYVPWHDSMELWSFQGFLSNTTLVYDSFNQSIPAILLTLIILHEEDLTSIVYLGGISFISMIFPTLGLLFLAIPLLIKRYKYIYEIFTLQNLIGIVAVIIPLIFFMGQIGLSVSSSDGLPVYLLLDSSVRPIEYAYMLFCEFYIYYILFIKEKYKDIRYIVIGILTATLPFIIYKGGKCEICMRASIPPDIYLMMLIIIFILSYDKKDNIEKKVRTYILIIFLLIGSVTPMVMFERGVYMTMKNGWKPKIEDSTYTFQRPNSPHNEIYTGKNYKDTLFRKTIGK